MREMDLLFSEYVSDHLEHMSAEELRTLEVFLEETDVDIMNWILKRTEPPCSGYDPILDTMRTLKNRHLNKN